MSRSLRIKQNCLNEVKLAVRRNGFPSQRALAEEVGFALATVSNFLTGKPVDYVTFTEICRQLALEWREIANLDSEVTNKKNETHTPSESDPDKSPPYPNGSIPLDSPFYLQRTLFEEQVNREIGKPGALVRIKAPREMGKTSFLLRVLDSAQHLGYRTAKLNIEQVDRAILGDTDRFCRWLCANTARQFHLKPRLDEYWDEDLGSKISCTSYLEDYILKHVKSSLVLALDEVNQIFEYPQVAKDFFPLLRSWYEEAKTLPIWQKLRLVIVHSTEIYVPLQLNQSPFNVGLPIQLTHFSLDEVQQLAQRYELNWTDGTEAKQLMDMVGGHPALIHTAIYHLSSGGITLAKLLDTAPTSTGIYSHHLQRHWITLQDKPELADALYLVMSSTEPVQLDPILAYKLSSMGLIKQLGNQAIPSCELYRRSYIKKEL
ncbi:MAG: AAA-like domain-containing protein [Cyanobacteria bacterium P01_E01_bin.42]